MTYDELFSCNNLYQAHLIARRSKRHKKEVILFEIDLGNNLWKIKKILNERKYEIKGYYHFIILEPKKREIQAMYY